MLLLLLVGEWSLLFTGCALTHIRRLWGIGEIERWARRSNKHTVDIGNSFKANCGQGCVCFYTISVCSKKAPLFLLSFDASVSFTQKMWLTPFVNQYHPWATVLILNMLASCENLATCSHYGTRTFKVWGYFPRTLIVCSLIVRLIWCWSKCLNSSGGLLSLGASEVFQNVCSPADSRDSFLTTGSKLCPVGLTDFDPFKCST